MKIISITLLLFCATKLLCSAGFNSNFVTLKGIDDANRIAVEHALKEYRFDYQKSGNEFWVEKKNALRITNTLRGDGVIGFPYVYYFPKTERFVEPDEVIDDLYEEKPVILAIIDDLDDEKSQASAKEILQSWGVSFIIYKGQIAVPREMEKKVNQKFKASAFSVQSMIIRTFILCKLPVFPPSPEEQQREEEQRVQRWFEESITNATLFEEGIFEVDVSMLSPLKWQIKVLMPKSYNWTETQKKRIVQKCMERSKRTKYLKDDEILEINFL